MNKRIYLIAVIGFLTFYINGQVIPNQYILSGDLAAFEQAILRNTSRSSSSIFQLVDTLSISQQLYLIRSDNLPTLRPDPSFRVKPDYKISLRAIPNDEKVNDQWALENINVFAAWDETLGDFDHRGSAPVIAIIDNGYQVDHPDLAENIFVNNLEVPDNGIDDDNNGFIDDYLGYNTESEGDDHPVEKHGTSTAGVISARGNNQLDISGVLWNNKALLISGIDSESEVIKAYDYVYQMRKAYNESNGARGAYIVACNFSGGLDNAWARDHEEWCNYYDLLGVEGILSVAATTNDDVEVDTKGDMPATCSSPYLVVVNDINRIEERSRSGTSATYVDLAAPGSDVLSLDIGNGVRNFNGTSAAAPHVAGAIVLLYTSPCTAFTDLIDVDPAGAALAIKEALLSGSRKLTSLVNKNRSGGTLDIFNSMARIAQLCENTSKILTIEKVVHTDRLIIQYSSASLEAHQCLLFDMNGRLMSTINFRPQLFLEKSVLIPLTDRLPSGIYYVHLSNPDRAVAQKIYIH